MILDTCCGSKMFWFNPQDERVIFGDIREESHVLCDGRTLEIKPDVLLDYRALPYPDDKFRMVVFDPPHLVHAGDKSWLKAKYGTLNKDWREDLQQGFSECFRVLASGGFLIFKWNETQIKVSEILALTDQKPLFRHKSGKRMDAHWICFSKNEG